MAEVGADTWPGPTDPWELCEGTLEWYRGTVLRKLAGLSEGQLRTPLPAVGWAPLGLVQHLGRVERRWLRWGFAAEDVTVDPPGGDDADFTVGATTTNAEVLAVYREEVRRARAAMSDADPRRRSAVGGRFATAEEAPTLGRILFHLLQEYARHTGQLDVARQMIDGQVGE